jgi:hypothetical protein
LRSGCIGPLDLQKNGRPHAHPPTQSREISKSPQSSLRPASGCPNLKN